MRLTILLATLLLTLSPCAAASTSDDAQIRVVIEEFRASLAAKDKERLLGLFLHDRITWQPVMSDERYAASLRSDPEARKLVYDPGNSPEKFIEDIVNSPAAIEETFSDIVIDTDGATASVGFDFEFLSNGKATNVGREHWLLVKSETGWKIAAVTWSRNAPPKVSGSEPGSGNGSRVPAGSGV